MRKILEEGDPVALPFSSSPLLASQKIVFSSAESQKANQNMTAPSCLPSRSLWIVSLKEDGFALGPVTYLLMAFSETILAKLIPNMWL